MTKKEKSLSQKLHLTELAIIILFLLVGWSLYQNSKSVTLVSKDVDVKAEMVEFFGDDTQGIRNLDTDLDGVVDIYDNDIDGDGVLNTDDDDVDGDGTKNLEDPSTALTNLLTSSLVEGKKGEKGDKGEPGSRGADGANGVAGANGANGQDGANGVVGVVTDDGVIKTTLTGSDLDVALVLGTGSGLEKTSSGLSLKTDCANGQVLGWNGSKWSCKSSSNGITYTAGSGINISGSTLSAVLGDSISLAELNTNLGLTGGYLANETITSNKILDGTITNEDIMPNTITASRLAPNSVNSSEIVTNAVGSSELRDNSTNGVHIQLDSEYQGALAYFDSVSGEWKVVSPSASGGTVLSYVNRTPEWVNIKSVSEFAAMAARVSQAENDITTLRQENSNLNVQIGNMQNDIANLESRILLLEAHH